MKKIFIIFLFIIFSSSFSLAKDNEKITVEEIENIFFGGFEKKKDNESWQGFFDRRFDDYLRRLNEKTEKRKSEEKEERKQKKDNETWADFFERIEDENPAKYKNCDDLYSFNINSQYIACVNQQRENSIRFQKRGIAKCMYTISGGIMGTDRDHNSTDRGKKCFAKVVRVVMSSSEKSKKRRPGDIFYVLDAIKYLVDNQKTRRKFINTKYLKNLEKVIAFNEGTKSIVCDLDLPYVRKYICRTFKKTTLKKIEKFKKDPSNEKVLGNALIKFIEQNQMVNRIEEKLGTANYVLLGDFLNATVADVEKNNINPGLQKRRALLKKYSLIMRSIKDKLNEEKYKSIDKDVSKLSKTYENLNALTTNSNETVINIDKAINIIFDANKLVQRSALSAKDNEEEKLLALASIDFMQTLIDSILSTIPEKYLVYTNEMKQDLFSESELTELEDIIDTMTNKNKKIKSAKLSESMDIINRYINTSDVLKTLSNLGMENITNKPLSRDSAFKIAKREISENLSDDILKTARKMFDEIDQNELAELTKEASNMASEIASDPSVKEATSGSILDKKFGEISVRQLIGAARLKK